MKQQKIEKEKMKTEDKSLAKTTTTEWNKK